MVETIEVLDAAGRVVVDQMCRCGHRLSYHRLSKGQIGHCESSECECLQYEFRSYLVVPTPHDRLVAVSRRMLKRLDSFSPVGELHELREQLRDALFVIGDDF